MWYLYKDPVVLNVIVYDDALVLVLAQKINTHQYAVLNYASFKSDLYALHNGIIFNLTAIKQTIASFLQKQNIHPSFLVIIIDNKQVVTHVSPAVQPCVQMPQDQTIRHKQAEHTHYIGPLEDTDHLLYSCHVSQYALLQYEILGSFFDIPLLYIACAMHSLVYAYRGCKKTAFRSSELVKDITRYADIVDFFTQDIINRLLYQVPVVDSMHKKAFLMTYGHLFYQEMLHG